MTACRSLLTALAAVLALGPVAEAGPRLEPAGDIVWSAGAPGFGSFSGLSVQQAGSRLVAVSDKGHIATGRLLRTGGRLTGAELIRITPLADRGGAPVSGRAIDGEGMATTPDGRLWVSFEAIHRVWSYGDPHRAATGALPRHPDYARLQNNSSLEALAADAAGALYTVPERSGVLTRPFPVYRYKDGAWSRFSKIPRRGPWLVAGAEIGPDGRFYLLERDFRMLRGFRTRIRRFAVKEGWFAGEETLLTTPFGALDNMEGIAVWRGGAGELRITLIADDNDSLFQRTRIVEYILRAAPAPRPRLRPGGLGDPA